MLECNAKSRKASTNTKANVKVTSGINKVSSNFKCGVNGTGLDRDCGQPRTRRTNSWCRDKAKQKISKACAGQAPKQARKKPAFLEGSEKFFQEPLLKLCCKARSKF